LVLVENEFRIPLYLTCLFFTARFVFCVVTCAGTERTVNNEQQQQKSMLSSMLLRSNRRTWVSSVRSFSDKKAKGAKAAAAAAAPPATPPPVTPPPPMAETSSSDAAAHRPVLHLNGLPARYANATYVVASKMNVLDQVESELHGLAATAAKSPKFADFLCNPLISRDVKTAAVTTMHQLSPVTRNLLSVLAGNARLAELPKVASTFTQLMKAKRGQVDAKIISAEPLSPAMMKEVQAAMQSQVPKGKTVIIEQVTDPTIVGGLQVQIGDQFLDLSIKSRIDDIARMPVT
jgi:F-type H+-transporting ATPase subunit O